MGLDVWLTAVRPVTIWEYSIAHTLGPMATAAGIYEVLWRPEEMCITTASQLIWPLRAGLARLIDDPDGYMRFDQYGRRRYEELVRFVRAYLAACEENPNATVGAGR